ncbi:molybdopterin-dependent oxidoreductase [uncultured Methanobrevibacter sp.]|uniref:molybdopterin-dependent oxidoreductase n=1 Tax=uncultured Methanobrevibacter sp. TaxID=253161 RepID=UPI0025CE5C1C|nr:molybdopterin-dependent oxidoreductase [uncultured Methanobrevibacter sp.]
MLEIKHTLCPSCSVGCGLNVIINNGEIVGTFPYKRHPVNAGKNCLNGRNSIECYQNKFDKAIVSKSETDIEKAIEEVSKELGSADSSNVTIICSGNNDMGEIEAIKEFGESKNFNLAFYADNLKDFVDVASYDEVAGASKVFVIGDLLYENPLIGRRIVHAKQNGAEIYALGKAEESVTFNIADETSNSTVEEFLEKNKGNIDDDSVIVFNYVDSQDDLDKIEALNCKCLPVFSKSNSKGTLGIIEPKSLDEMLELLDNTKVLLVFNDDIADELEYDFSKISKIISFAPCSNKTTEISDIVIPTKTWLEKDGSFVNAMGETQIFTAAVESDALSEIEIIEKLNG